MPSHQLVETVRQSFFVERADETNADRNIVGRALRCQLIQEPHALLRKRERQQSVARDGCDEGDRQLAWLTWPLLGQPLGEASNCRSLKYGSEGGVDVKERT